MKTRGRWGTRLRRALPAAAALGLALLGGGCATPWQTAALVAGGVTVAGAQAPDREISQTYYLGVFDPREQVPPSIYRVTVNGQASFLCRAKFASGWVPAGIVDSLTGRIGLDVNSTNDTVTLTAPGEHDFSGLKQGRKLVLFGPEGFREAPKDHRLVLVMGASPKDFFEAVDAALGAVGTARHGAADQELKQQLRDKLIAAQAEESKLLQLQQDLAVEFPKEGGPR